MSVDMPVVIQEPAVCSVLSDDVVVFDMKTFPKGTVEAVLMDIEGTTTSILFVHDVLFPYAKREMQAFIAEHETCLGSILDEVKYTAEAPDADLKETTNILLSWMEQDKKITSLKTLQGMMWEEGYKKGEFVGHIYEDAFVSMSEWFRQQMPLYIYSSGSVQSQKLLFSHSSYGDLSPMLSGYFDTNIGDKKQKESYVKIADAMKICPKSILFLSDSIEEVQAAKEAGLQTLLLARNGNGPENTAWVRSFNQIQIPPSFIRTVPKDVTDQIIRAGKFLGDAKLCPATSGNLSSRISADLIAITVSGKNKSLLTQDDVLVVDLAGKAVTMNKTPSAEALIHTAVYSVLPDVNAILHHHSVNSVVLSKLLADAFVTHGYEMHKALGCHSHESVISIPIFDNSQDYLILASRIQAYLKEHPSTIGVFLRGHGLYVWGYDMDEAQKRVEALEFLFETEWKLRSCAMLGS